MNNRLLFTGALTVLLAASLFSCAPKTGTRLKAKIVGYKGEPTELFYMDKASGEYKEILLPVSKEGVIDTTFTLDSSLYYTTLFVDKFMFRVSIEKGKNYDATFDITKPDVETNFRFKGNGAQENEFTRDFGNGFGIPYIFLSPEKAANGFKAYSDSIVSASSSFLARLDKINNQGFDAFFKDELSATSTKYRLFYPYLALAANPADTAASADPDYLAFLTSGVLDSLSDKEFSDCYSLICTYVTQSFPDVDIIDFLKVAAATTDNESRKGFILTNLMLDYMGSGKTDNLDAAYKYYTSQCTMDEYESQVKEAFHSQTGLVKGAEAPDIEFKDESGKVFHLADFKGKVLYVDLWASWCGPCCQEIPYLAKLVEALSGNSRIECISISTDTDEAAWKKKLADEKPSWKQFIATEKGQTSISRAYNVAGIPRFMIFTADGKIYSADAPRPSDSDIREVLTDATK
jgi:thiol-disulfide isomerase/thioredoxin